MQSKDHNQAGGRQFSIAHLTAIDLQPHELIHLAARCGYDAVGLRLIRVTDTSPGYPLMEDPAMMRAAQSALADTGVFVNDIEFVKLTPDLEVATLEAMLAAGAALGARHVICAPYDPDLPRLAARLAQMTELAAGYGIKAMLEFFPWTVVPDLPAARAIVAASGADAGILVDALHFDRSGSTLADLAALPPAQVPFLHLCDAPVHPPYSTDDLLHAGRAERLPPLEGQIDLTAFLGAFPAQSLIALEVPMTAATAREGIEAVAKRVIAAARTCAAQAQLR